MSNIIETKFGTLVNTSKIAAGSASSIKKSGAFYNFSIRIAHDDIREYSFTNLARAEYMRRIMIDHLEQKIKKLNDKNNPPKLIISFFNEQENIDDITCYSNDGGNWKKSNLRFEKHTLTINFNEKFLPRRGRINCSLNDNGKWRWFGTQFVIKKD